MKFLIVVAFLLTQVNYSDAAATCQRDGCYNAVANGLRGAPNLNSRKADCSSILLKVVEDDKTITITRSTTLVSNTITITTQSDSLPGRRRRASLAQITPAPDADTELFPRDQVIVSGTRPNYVSAACKNVQSYAVACLCYGIKAATYRTIKSATSTRSIYSTATTTTGFDFVAYLEDEGQEFCSSFIGYVPSTTTTFDTTGTSTTSTVVETSTISYSSLTTETIASTTSVPAPIWLRAIMLPPGVPTPVLVRGRASSEISSFCSRAVSGIATESVSTQHICHCERC